MNILVIDAAGGGIGRQLVEAVRQHFPEASLTAVGTNQAASMAMRKAGAETTATGENAVIVACRSADIILGPVGIAIPDALLGEITPRMAEAVAKSRAVKYLLPISHGANQIVGVRTWHVNIAGLVEDAMEEMRRI